MIVTVPLLISTADWMTSPCDWIVAPALLVMVTFAVVDVTKRKARAPVPVDSMVPELLIVLSDAPPVIETAGLLLVETLPVSVTFKVLPEVTACCVVTVVVISTAKAGNGSIKAAVATRRA